MKMPEYCFNRQFENETKVRIETNDRKLLLGIEQAINDFISNFKNENEETDGIELMDLIGIENWNYFGIENEEQIGIELLKNNGNELQSQIQNSSENIRGNELSFPIYTHYFGGISL